MAYLKRWAARAANPLELREPGRVAGPAGAVACADANGLAPALDGIDLAYVDPPYNQHSYLGNYHVWETLVRGDRPEHYGVACKRADCRTRKSAYNSRRAAWSALAGLIDGLATPWVIVSVSDEGFHDPADVERRLARARPRGSDPGRLQALRGRPDRDPQPRRRAGGIRLAPAEHGVAVRVRPRPRRGRAGGRGRPRELPPPAAGLILIDCGGMR